MSLISTRPTITERDPDSLAMRFRGNWREVRRLEPVRMGRFETNTGRVLTPRLALIEMSTTGFRMDIAHSRFVMLSLPSRAGLLIRSGSRRWETNAKAAHFAEGRPFEVDYAPDFRGHSILVEKRAFREAAEAHAGEPLPTTPRHSALLHAAQVRAVRAEIAGLEHELRIGGLSTAGETLAPEIETRLLAAMLSGPLASGAGRAAISAASRVSVQRAVDFMRAHYADSLRAEQLARATGSNLRALQAAFRRTYGASLWQYLLMCRLEAVHRRLREPDDQATITEAALDAGFTHLGEFGRLYRQRFGERPSDTRSKRRCDD